MPIHQYHWVVWVGLAQAAQSWSGNDVSPAGTECGDYRNKSPERRQSFFDAQETTASMADTEKRSGEGYSSRPCAASGMPVVMVAVSPLLRGYRLFGLIRATLP